MFRAIFNQSRCYSPWHNLLDLLQYMKDSLKSPSHECQVCRDVVCLHTSCEHILCSLTLTQSSSHIYAKDDEMSLVTMHSERQDLVYIAMGDTTVGFKILESYVNNYKSPR